MQFVCSSQFPFVNSKPPHIVTPRVMDAPVGARKIDCGWYDSSLELARGLEISEDDNDTLYQLWELSRN